MELKIKKIAALTGHSGPVYRITGGPEPHLIFSCSGDQVVAQWDLQMLEAAPFAAKFPAIVYSLCYVKEQNLLLAGTSTGAIHIIDMDRKKEIRMLQHHAGPVFDIAYSAKHNSFYSASGDGRFSVCSLDTLSLLGIRKLCDAKVRSIACNDEMGKIAVASGDCMIRIYDMISLEEVKMFRAHDLSANAVAWHPNDDLLMTGGRDAHLNVWDIKNDYQLVRSVPAHNYAIYGIAFSPDSTLLATASRDKTMKLWDAGNADFLLRVNKEKQDGHTHSVNTVFWSSFNSYILSAGDDRSIMVWSLE
jgi:WD40 repeat protein